LPIRAEAQESMLGRNAARLLGIAGGPKER
jgi:hypothetical protein